jgi:hypothetical protein
VLAWVVIQVTQAVVPALSLPDWVNSFALFFAWAFEVTPEGIKKESDITPEESITAHTARKLDFTIIDLLKTLLFLLYQDTELHHPVDASALFFYCAENRTSYYQVTIQNYQ